MGGWEFPVRDTVKWDGIIWAKGIHGDELTWGSGTTGSVLFIGSNGKITQDNSNLYWDDTNNRLGIGTITPDTLLEIEGAHVTDLGMLHLDSTDHAFISLDAVNPSDAGIYFSESGTPQMDIAWDSSENEIIFRDITGGNVRRMVIEQTGNVGIGTTSPGSLLEVNSGSGTGSVTFKGSNGSTDSRFQFTAFGGSTGNRIMTFNSGDSIAVTASSSGTPQDLRLQSAGGKVGIGTTSPSTVLSINGSDDANQGQLVIIDKDNPSTNVTSKSFIAGYGNDISGATGKLWSLGSSSGTSHNIAFINSITDAELYLTTTGTGDVILLPGGNVGIGTTSPQTTLTTSGAHTLGNVAAPATPTGGGALFASGGEIWWIGSSGTKTRLAVA